MATIENLFRSLEQLNAFGVALSQERDINALLEKILHAAKGITGADGGTLYRVIDGDRLQFEMVLNDSLGIALGGTTGNAISFYPVKLYLEDGAPNTSMIAAYAALTGNTVNIPDAYTAQGFDFSGTRNFDKKTGYRSTSFLTVPMRDHENEIIGVLQLLNRLDPATGRVVEFSDADQRMAESLASQAAIALTNLENLLKRLEQLNAVGVALSQERDINALLEKILHAAKGITGADGGTLYRLIEGERLQFEIVLNDSLGIALGGTTGNPISFYPIKLYGEGGAPNTSMVAAYAALTGNTVNIPDAYTAQGFDFSGTRNFDKKTGYRSTSFLTIPMRDHENEIIGVLQLLNRLDPITGRVIEFSDADQRMTESLASQAAIALTNRNLIVQLEQLFESFINMINTAIDEKSPYTGGHCQRVPTLTMMLAEAASATREGPLADFTMTDRDRYELKIAGLLHDCGKVTTPVHVVDKSTKLETIYDRIHLLDTRFEVLKRDAEIACLKGEIDATEHAARLARYDDDRAFLRRANIGGEFMREEDIARVRNIAAYRWRAVDGTESNFLSDDEVKNLTVRAGTLTAEEREIINYHIIATIKMLEALPWPRHLKNVPEYAGGHHERMDGKGYPKGLKRDQMSVQARVMGIADIFEALTARDRPYKKGKTLTESLEILGKFKLNGHVDPDLFDVFIREKVYMKYAEEFMNPEQIDDVDLAKIPGVGA